MRWTKSNKNDLAPNVLSSIQQFCAFVFTLPPLPFPSLFPFLSLSFCSFSFLPPSPAFSLSLLPSSFLPLLLPLPLSPYSPLSVLINFIESSFSFSCYVLCSSSFLSSTFPPPSPSPFTSLALSFTLLHCCFLLGGLLFSSPAIARKSYFM